MNGITRALEPLGRRLMVPFYNLYYLITRWSSAKKPFFIALFGVAVMLGVTLVGFSPAKGTAEWHAVQGDNLEEESRYDEAIEEYSEAIRLDPEFVVAYNNRGLAYRKLGQFERGIEDYNEAIRLDPEFVAAYNNRGLAYRKLGQFERAIEDYNEAIRLDPEVAVAYYNRGYAYGSLGQFERAIEDYNEAIRLIPQYALAYLSRGLAYETQGEKNKAIADYEKALTLINDPQGIQRVRQLIDKLSK